MVDFRDFEQHHAYEVILHLDSHGPLFFDRPSAEAFQKKLHEAGKEGSEIYRIPLWRKRTADDNE